MVCTKHNWTYYEGLDGILDRVREVIDPTQRLCLECGDCQLYSGLSGSWVYVGHVSEHHPCEYERMFL